MSGKAPSDGPDRQAQLRDLFVTVTGTTEFVEEQAAEETAGHGVAESDDDVPEYVSAMVREDGLGEALDGPGDDLVLD
ncbi:hypothetical protein [Haloarcula litorea]|uniref:hypothetical protein n=1 Tax=Haloarcula litorea TaxID=3032579 RepID=UPI0023E8B85F|nr:hypothetical protein [Halomicroarcula sp. GDY20]